MGTFYVSPASLRNLKARIASTLPDIPSSHLSESLAAALGVRTHAALNAMLAAAPTAAVGEPCDTKFAQRVRELGHGTSLHRWRGLPRIPSGDETRNPYTGKRARAWRNMMVAAINAGLAQRLFGLQPGENYFRPGTTDSGRGLVCQYEFVFGGTIPALAAVNDAGYGELSIHVALNPKRRSFVGAAFAGRSAGEAYAEGWLERTLGVWLQSGGGCTLAASRALTNSAASIEVLANGFGDRGRLMM